MTFSAWLSLLANAVGVVLVMIGLYRRDAGMQGKVAAPRLSRRVRSRSPAGPAAGAPNRAVSQEAAPTPSAQATNVPPRPGPPPNRDAPVEERLQWVERAVDRAFRGLEPQTLRHDEKVGDLVERVVQLRDALEANAGRQRERADEGAPQRLEWWGVVLVLVGLAFAVIDTVARLT